MQDTSKLTDIASAVSSNATSLDTVWVLVAAVLVMFMQPGFAMVEAGFTRAKNTANILMKNLMDFSVGSLAFWLVGFSLMFGSDIGSFIGKPNLFFTASYGNDIPDLAILFFQTVFAATAATIVSGAVAERTKFSSYLIFSVVITLFIYPVSGHWVWGGGWLSELGFHDFAGSTVVHSVGAWLGLVGAIMVGPRIGKYNGKSKAIPGHNLTFGALGVFILWFGWFGFNPGSQLAAAGSDNSHAISLIFITTNLAAAAGALTSMFVSWGRYKFPSLSLTLNGALAGLVAITAGCDTVTPGGAIIIGAVAGIILVFGVEFIDQKLRIDDPVGAVSVHGLGGAAGTLMVGLFSTNGGLFYGGGAKLLGIQAIGVLAVMAWTLGTGYILFKVLKSTIGLRVSRRIEEEGLDVYEHGESAYN
ncbi:ammonium transporter [Prolixibacter denitrificans]|uniref:Ammonium transporter n=1 Tax=Prolixibacter denitrificans TaxID=1541063 RepID=A0A2P8CJU6_9BACT|nr:ammonium transporter [Prolixibacter denitrificans]PSK85234.1 Amt family ammonium transporter [Prolixibacter denitrificans]GET19856.1 ammonium transporter [Prolixibacter denitrificans]